MRCGKIEDWSEKEIAEACSFTLLLSPMQLSKGSGFCIRIYLTKKEVAFFAEMHNNKSGYRMKMN